MISLQVFSILTLLAGSAAIAESTVMHDNTTPINDKAAKGVVDNNAAVAGGDLTAAQGKELNRKDRKIEREEQKNADQRHGLVARSDHAKFNKRAKHVNAERAKTMDQNAEEKAEKKKEESK